MATLGMTKNGREWHLTRRLTAFSLPDKAQTPYLYPRIMSLRIPKRWTGVTAASSTRILLNKARPVPDSHALPSRPQFGSRRETTTSLTLSFPPDIMKVLYVAYATALASLVRGDTVSTTYPGRCLATKDCAVYGSGLECIAVDSNTKGLEKLSMCIPSGSICSGQIAGSCPTFSSWPATYRKVMTVCAFTVVENCDKQIAVTVKQTTTGSGSGQTTGEGEITVGDSSGSSSNTTVECYKRTFTANNENKTVNGIYKCLDARKYIQENLGHITNLTNSHIISCGGDLTSTTPKLCSGQGTCSPKTAFAQEYECKCNAGYSGTLCANVTSNVCSNLGQCGSSGTCVLTAGQTSGTCTCKGGSTGNQCSSCDASSSSACNGNGKCDSGVCSCNSGYSGTLCADRTSTGGTTDSASSLFTMVTATLSTMAAIGVMIFA